MVLGVGKGVLFREVSLAKGDIVQQQHRRVDLLCTDVHVCLSFSQTPPVAAWNIQQQQSHHIRTIAVEFVVHMYNSIAIEICCVYV